MSCPKTLALGFLLAGALGLAACSSTTVHADWDHQADFTHFHTYAWLAPSDPQAAPHLPEHLDIRLRRIVDEILDAKGYQPAVPPNLPDFELVYYLDVDRELRVDTIAHDYYGAYGWRGVWPGIGPTTRVREITTGTLVLDVVDRASNRLVWTGSVAGTARHENPSGERIQAVMEAMLSDFPPLE